MHSSSSVFLPFDFATSRLASRPSNSIRFEELNALPSSGIYLSTDNVALADGELAKICEIERESNYICRRKSLDNCTEFHCQNDTTRIHLRINSIMIFDTNFRWYLFHRKFNDQTNTLITIRMKIRNRIFSLINFKRQNNNKLIEICEWHGVSANPCAVASPGWRFIATLSFEHVRSFVCQACRCLQPHAMARCRLDANIRFVSRDTHLCVTKMKGWNWLLSDDWRINEEFWQSRADMLLPASHSLLIMILKGKYSKRNRNIGKVKRCTSHVVVCHYACDTFIRAPKHPMKNWIHEEKLKIREKQ